MVEIINYNLCITFCLLIKGYAFFSSDNFYVDASIIKLLNVFPPYFNIFCMMSSPIPNAVELALSSKIEFHVTYGLLSET